MRLTPIDQMQGNQSKRSILAWHMTDARKALDAAVAQLAHRSGTPAVDRASLGNRDDEPTPAKVVDLAQLAIVAEAVVRLGDEIDALRHELADLKGRV